MEHFEIFHEVLPEHHNENLYVTLGHIKQRNRLITNGIFKHAWHGSVGYNTDFDESRLVRRCLNRAPKSFEILMFYCLQKDDKQCCDAKKLSRTHWACQRHAGADSDPLRSPGKSNFCFNLGPF